MVKILCVDCAFKADIKKMLTGHAVEKTCDGCGRFGDYRAAVEVYTKTEEEKNGH